MNVRHSRYLAEHIPGARLVIQPGRDCLPFLGDSEAVLGEIEEFLTGTRHSSEPDRVLATVLVTDIVGSTRLAASLGDRRWRDLLAEHDEVVRTCVDRHQGRVVRTEGDGVWSTFDGPARAINAARAIVSNLQPLGIDVRTGLHTGEVEVVGDGVAGVAVDIGERVAGAAGSGEVLVSSTVKDLVVGSGLSFEPRGEQELEGVPGRWRLWAVAA
jgi:class 3 adenylate cyclase